MSNSHPLRSGHYVAFKSRDKKNALSYNQEKRNPGKLSLLTGFAVHTQEE
jgi:hypothetical protein